MSKIETTVRKRCLCDNFIFYMRFVSTIIMPLILTGTFLAIAISVRNEDTTAATVLFAIAGVALCFSLTTQYYCCINQFIPRYVYGCRRKMRKHDLSLEETLNRLANYIPSIEKVVDIEELARKNLDEISWGLRWTFKVPFEIFLTGSTAERFNSPLSSLWMKCVDVNYSHALISDYDYMMSPENTFASYQPGEGFIIKDDTLDINPGYVKLVYGDNKNSSAMSFYKTRNVTDKLKSIISKIPKKTFNGYNSDDCEFASVINKGPTLKLKAGKSEYKVNQFLADLTFSIPCKDWPASSNWQARTKKWPQQEDVKRITFGGIHLVPLSQKGDKEGLTWRISFSKAEVELSKLISEVARTCFVALKVIRKDYLSVNCHHLKSYHLKTILLYSIEATGLEFWCEENLKECFDKLLGNLTTAIEERSCPHFWLPHINLFEDLSEKDQKKVLKVLREVKDKPEKFIELLTEKEEKNQRDTAKMYMLGSSIC